MLNCEDPPNGVVTVTGLNNTRRTGDGLRPRPAGDQGPRPEHRSLVVTCSGPDDIVRSRDADPVVAAPELDNGYLFQVVDPVVPVVPGYRGVTGTAVDVPIPAPSSMRSSPEPPSAASRPGPPLTISS
jgi:hypothetical protein